MSQKEVWPDVRIKSRPTVSQSCPSSGHSNFYFFQNSQNSHLFLGYFGKKIVAKNFEQSANLATLTG